MHGAQDAATIVSVPRVYAKKHSNNNGIKPLLLSLVVMPCLFTAFVRTTQITFSVMFHRSSHLTRPISKFQISFFH